MSHFNFIILPKNDLLNVVDEDAYRVDNVIPIREIADKLQDAKIGFEADGTDFILENFDTFFSILIHGKKLQKSLIENGMSRIIKAYKQFVTMLAHYLDEQNELESDMLKKICNLLKMLTYIYSGFISLKDEINNPADDNSLLTTKKKARKNRSEDRLWSEEKNELLAVVYTCMELPIHKLWEPPIVEADFITLVADTCYKALEDPAVKTEQTLNDTIFEILGTLIKTYKHGVDCPSRLIKLLQTTDHLVSPISQGVCKLVTVYGCKSLINRLIRKIVEWQMGDQIGLSSHEIKQCSSFLVELAIKMPDKMVPEVMYLGTQLGNDVYQLRITILTIMAEVTIVLSGEGLTEEAKEQRDNLLDMLEEHFYDINSFVRSKVLQLWTRLQQEHAIPLNRQLTILKKCIERLNDKIMSVRKSAIIAIKIFLECNPFAPTLNIEKIEKQLNEEQVKLKFLEDKLRSVESLEKKTHWVIIHAELRDFIQDKLSESAEDSLNQSKDDSLSEKENIVLEIKNFLMKKDFENAYRLLRASERQIAKAKDHRKTMSIDEQIDFTLLLLHNLFMETENTDQPQLSAEEIIQYEQQHEIQDQLVTFLQASKEFAQLFTEAAEIIADLLKSKSISECMEAINYFTTANNFVVRGNLDCALGMLSLVYANEVERTGAVGSAFRTMFLTSNAKSKRGYSVEIVKNLIKLIQNIDRYHYEAFRQLILQWVKDSTLTQDEIQLLWEIFTLKIPDITTNDSMAAVKLLIIVAEAKPEIVEVNLHILESINSTRGKEDLRIVEATCTMFLSLAKLYAGASNKAPRRFMPDSEFVTNLLDLFHYTWQLQNVQYLPVYSKIIDVWYAICERPDSICTKVILQYYNEMYESGGEHGHFGNIHSLTQFLHIVGHVALRHLVYLDVTIYNELKRRNQYREELQNKKKTTKKNKPRTIPHSNSSVISNSSGMTSASLSRKQQQEMDEEQLAVEGAVADDADAEYILQVLEKNILGQKELLGQISNIVLYVCQNPTKYNDEYLMVTAVNALCKFSYISNKYADQYLQLIFTILEKSEIPIIRNNILLALTDLVKRFPNLVEPWTPHIYKRLRDPSLQVRQMAMIMLSHLIQHDLIRVKGHISEMAICVVDEDKRISQLAKCFLKQLSLKGNALYNVMPDIISKLSDTSSAISENEFKTILKYIMDLIQKEKQMESLVSKLCARLRVSVSIRQWCDLSFCLSIIHYNERGINHLIENVNAIKEKLHNEQVYNYFQAIINASKHPKAEVKALLQNLSDKIEECLKAGLPAEEAAIANVTANISNVNISRRSSRVQRTVKKRAKQRNSSGDSSESDNEVATTRSSTRSRPVRISQRQRSSRVLTSSSPDSENSTRQNPQSSNVSHKKRRTKS